MELSEKYGLEKRYKEIEAAGNTLYDFLKSVSLEHFAFDVISNNTKNGFLCCGLVYKECNDVECLLKKTLSRINCDKVWKVFQFHSSITDCEYFRIVLEE